MDQKAVVKYFYEVVVSQHRLDEVPAYVSEGCVFVSGETRIPMGTEGMKEHLAAVRKTYPDYSIRILRQYQEGDHVVSEFTMEGTHEGEWAGIRPTHRKLTFTGVNIDQVTDNKITAHGGAVNTFETLLEAQLIGPA